MIPMIEKQAADFNTDMADVVVIGGGVIGICTALALQKSGKRVILIERDAIAGGASDGNAGHIATEQVYPVASLEILKDIPKMLLNPLGPLHIDCRYLLPLMPWFLKLFNNLRDNPFSASSIALQQINKQSLSAWQQLLEVENLTKLMQVNGCYLVAEKLQSVKTLQDKIVTFNRDGVPAEWLDKDALHTQLPILNNNQLGGLFFPKTAHLIDPKMVCQQLEKRFHEQGGQTIFDDVLTVKDEGDRVTLILHQHKQMTAKQAVVACGVFSKKLVKSLTGIDVPLQAERGYHLMTEMPAKGLAAPITSFDRRFIMTPMQGGLRLAGTVEYSSVSAKPNYQRATNLLKLANGMLNDPLIRTADKPWMGCRPTLPDSLPVIDRIGNIGYAFGHQHLGLTQAAITGQWMTKLMHEQRIEVNLKPYQLSRFQ